VSFCGRLALSRFRHLLHPVGEIVDFFLLFEPDVQDIDTAEAENKAS
jgi:hypothetical protein